MQRFRIRTLVDITRTYVFKESIDLFKKKQQDNFQTLHQTLEMRAIIFTEKDPEITTMDWSEYGYGKDEKTWEWEIYTERDDLFELDNDPCGGMKRDVNFVPFTTGCHETAKFQSNCFSTDLKPTNILFELIDK
jgi:hypothetical protein